MNFARQVVVSSLDAIIAVELVILIAASVIFILPFVLIRCLIKEDEEENDAAPSH